MASVKTQFWYPIEPNTVITPVSYTSAVIDATGEKVAFIGRVWNKDYASKNITKVGFRFGAVTKAGGSALTVSLQDVNLAASPIQPDEVQDQTVAIANGDATFAANTWHQTAALSASRSVAFGELLAVVIEYDGAGRLGADTVAITGLNNSSSARGMSGTSLKTASWAAQAITPNVILEFDDGTFGTLDFGWPTSSISTINVNINSNPDEIALEFSLPCDCKFNGGYWTTGSAANTTDFNQILYNASGTAVATIFCDMSAWTTIGQTRPVEVTFPEITYTKNEVWRWAYQPTFTANASPQYINVSTANHLQAYPGGTACVYAERVNAGAWTTTTGRRPFAGIRVSSIDDGTGTGGGGAAFYRPVKAF